jgi:hypothetical protein
MAYKHPLQQTAVFATLVNFFEAPLELNPEIMVIVLERPGPCSLLPVRDFLGRLDLLRIAGKQTRKQKNETYACLSTPTSTPRPPIFPSPPHWHIFTHFLWTIHVFNGAYFNCR